MTSVRSGSANRPIRVATISPDSIQSYRQIQADIVRLLETARRAVARSINAAMTATYWEIGRRLSSSNKKELSVPPMGTCSCSGWPRI
jgi:hypothetical protein